MTAVPSSDRQTDVQESRKVGLMIYLLLVPLPSIPSKYPSQLFLNAFPCYYHVLFTQKAVTCTIVGMFAVGDDFPIIFIGDLNTCLLCQHFSFKLNKPKILSFPLTLTILETLDALHEQRLTSGTFHRRRGEEGLKRNAGGTRVPGTMRRLALIVVSEEVIRWVNGE